MVTRLVEPVQFWINSVCIILDNSLKAVLLAQFSTLVTAGGSRRAFFHSREVELTGPSGVRESLVIYCQRTGVRAAHAAHCATYCTLYRPLIRAFSGWIRTPPPTFGSYSKLRAHTVLRSYHRPRPRSIGPPKRQMMRKTMSTWYPPY